MGYGLPEIRPRGRKAQFLESIGKNCLYPRTIGPLPVRRTTWSAQAQMAVRGLSALGLASLLRLAGQQIADRGNLVHPLMQDCGDTDVTRPEQPPVDEVMLILPEVA